MDDEFPNICVEMKDDFLLVKVLTDLDFKIADQAKNAFNHLIEHVDRNVKLDLTLSNNIDASGIGAIVFFYKRLKSYDFDLEMIGVNNQSLKLIQSLDINKVITINPGNISS